MEKKKVMFFRKKDKKSATKCFGGTSFWVLLCDEGGAVRTRADDALRSRVEWLCCFASVPTYNGYLLKKLDILVSAFSSEVQCLQAAFILQT